MKEFGVWLDFREARIMPGDGSDNVIIVPSNIEENHPVGGYGSSDKSLPQDAVSTTKFAARKKQQMHAYFHEVMSTLSDAERIYLLGPGETRKHFAKHVEGHTSVGFSILSNEPCDSLTSNQLRSKVREYFEKIDKQ